MGTDSVGFGDNPPSNNPVAVKECYFSRFESGKIVEYKQYADRLSLYEQVGVDPPKPQKGA